MVMIDFVVENGLLRCLTRVFQPAQPQPCGESPGLPCVRLSTNKPGLAGLSDKA